MARISKEKMEEIRGGIMKAAAKSFLDKGYENTSTKALAQEVGIAEGTLFNYFNTKADLYMDVLITRLQLNEDLSYPMMSPEPNVHDMIADYVKQLYMPMMGLSKFMLQEMMQVLLSISKKNFVRIERLANYDFRYIQMTENLLVNMIDMGLLKKYTDTQLLSEMIYSAVFFEFSLYLYKKDMTINHMNDKVKRKIQFICEGHLSNVDQNLS